MTLLIKRSIYWYYLFFLIWIILLSLYLKDSERFKKSITEDWILILRFAVSTSNNSVNSNKPADFINSKFTDRLIIVWITAAVTTHYTARSNSAGVYSSILSKLFIIIIFSGKFWRYLIMLLKPYQVGVSEIEFVVRFFIEFIRKLLLTAAVFFF